MTSEIDINEIAGADASGLLKRRVPRHFIDAFTERMQEQGYEIRPGQREAIIAHLTQKIGITRGMMSGNEPLPEEMSSETIAREIADYLAVEGSEQHQRIYDTQLAIFNNTRANPAAKGKSGVGAVVYQLREYYGESMDRFGARFGVDGGTVRQWEDNVIMPNPQAFGQMCAAGPEWEALFTYAREKKWRDGIKEAAAAKDHGALVFAYRGLKEMTQAELGAEITVNGKKGVTNETIGKIEAGGYPKVKSMVHSLMDALEVPPHKRIEFLHVWWHKDEAPHRAMLAPETGTHDFYALMHAAFCLTHLTHEEAAKEMGCGVSALSSWHSLTLSNQRVPTPDNLTKFLVLCEKMNKKLPGEYRWVTGDVINRIRAAHAPLWMAVEAAAAPPGRETRDYALTGYVKPEKKKQTHGLGLEIYHLRHSLKESRREFGARFGVDADMIDRWEYNLSSPTDAQFETMCDIDISRARRLVVAREKPEEIFRKEWTQKKKDALSGQDRPAMIEAYMNLAGTTVTALQEHLGASEDTLRGIIYPRDKSIPARMLPLLQVPEEERDEFLHAYWKEHDAPHREVVASGTTDFHKLMNAYTALMHQDMSVIAARVGCTRQTLKSWGHPNPDKQRLPEPETLKNFIDECTLRNRGLPESYVWFTDKDETRLLELHQELMDAAQSRSRENLFVSQGCAVAAKEVGTPSNGRQGRVHG